MGAREFLMFFGFSLLLVGGILMYDNIGLGITFVFCSPIPYGTLWIAERFRKPVVLETEPVVVVKTDS
jgi:hypothetical protein